MNPSELSKFNQADAMEVVSCFPQLVSVESIWEKLTRKQEVDVGIKNNMACQDTRIRSEKTVGHYRNYTDLEPGCPTFQNVSTEAKQKFTTVLYKLVECPCVATVLIFSRNTLMQYTSYIIYHKTIYCDFSFSISLRTIHIQ
jgi:hypothetical protein